MGGLVLALNLVVVLLVVCVVLTYVFYKLERRYDWKGVVVYAIASYSMVIMYATYWV